MAKNLVIVESPTKVKAISKYLGKDYLVTSSKGHIRDLSTKGKFGLGVDIDNHFKPDYKTIKGKKPVIDELKKDAKGKKVFLATDPDREGEAIAWHIYDVLGLKDKDYERVLFPEITKKTVQENIKKEGKIDDNLVKSQETRRILDRIIGFRLSKLIRSKTDGTSAGRVQSVALKLIVDREREIQKFKSEEYWTITALFDEFNADLFEYNHKKIEIKNEKEANAILDKLSDEFKISEIVKKDRKRESRPVYTTSTLQQDASNKLRFSSRRTMSIAQRLYEGIDIDKDTVGLITYMRTDSTRLSDEFVGSTFNFIEKNYGKEYIGHVKKSKKKENVQDGHEGIRPTSIERTPESIKKYLTDEQYKLYRLIYYRALASLMKGSTIEGTTIILDNNNYQFKVTGGVIKFDGYLKVYKDYEDTKEVYLPSLKDNDILKSKAIEKEQHFTQPPARYTEAKLIKEMDELGIGRPSTYATIISNIVSRGYVNLEDRKFVPTEIGFEVTDGLQKYFSHIINVKYTADMENDLDKIAEGKETWYKLLESFYNDFEPAVEDALDKMPKKEAKETGEMCPECGHPLVVRRSRYGTFVGCSNYPECKYIKKEAPKESIICDCPNCGGHIIVKRSRKGKVFYGCDNYPDCKTAYWDKPIGEKCPKCGSMLVETKKKTIKCSDCDYKKND